MLSSVSTHDPPWYLVLRSWYPKWVGNDRHSICVCGFDIVTLLTTCLWCEHFGACHASLYTHLGEEWPFKRYSIPPLPYNMGKRKISCVGSIVYVLIILYYQYCRSELENLLKNMYFVHLYICTLAYLCTPNLIGWTRIVMQLVNWIMLEI